MKIKTSVSKEQTAALFLAAWNAAQTAFDTRNKSPEAKSAWELADAELDATAELYRKAHKLAGRDILGMLDLVNHYNRTYASA